MRRAIVSVFVAMSCLLAAVPAAGAAKPETAGAQKGTVPSAAGLVYVTEAGGVFAIDSDGAARRVYRSTRGIGPISRSPNGQYVAFRVGDFGSDIVVVDLETKEFQTWECQCGDPYVTGGHAVAFDAERRMYRLPLDGSDAVVTQTNLSASRIGQDIAATVLMATSRKAVVAIGDPRGPSAYGGPERLFTVRRNGSVDRMLLTDGNTFIATSARRSGRPVVAFPEQTHIDACRTRGSVAVFNVRTERKRSLPAPGRGAWQVVELGYDAAGRVVASWVKTSLTADGDCFKKAGPSLFRRVNGDWNRVKRNVSWFSFSDSGARASVAPAPDGSFTGTLTVPSADGRVPVSDGVYDVAW